MQVQLLSEKKETVHIICEKKVCRCFTQEQFFFSYLS